MTDIDQQQPHLTISQAAEAAGVHRRAIRRCLDAGELPNAHRAAGPRGERTWIIPVADLLAAGLRLDVPTTPDETDASEDEPSELDLLREELAEERTRRRVAEALADERARTLERADAAISALNARTPAPTPRRRQGRRRRR